MSHPHNTKFDLNNLYRPNLGRACELRPLVQSVGCDLRITFILRFECVKHVISWRALIIVKVDDVPDDIQEDVKDLQKDRNCKDSFESDENVK